ncbi:MAG: DUF930 domain-containing protein [Roseibium sp.]
MTASTAPGASSKPRLVSDHFAWVCAIWLHLAVYSVLMSQPGTRNDLPRLSDPVMVDLIPLSRLLSDPAPPTALPETNTAALPPDATSPEVAANSSKLLPNPPEPQENAPKPQKTWVTASHFLATDVLKDKSNTKALRALATLVMEEKWTQICALEAMEQVAANEPDLQPIRLNPHAVRNAFQQENRIIAPAGALFSGKLWYEIAYRCELDDNGTKITAFQYALGSPIPRKAWSDLGLLPIHEIGHKDPH